ncbi:MAG: Na+/H+ antiporter subunit D [Alphaproteobacteria bacterium]|nr:Na+/H+ antiporter subunit D [Alphaproteobacteria bacterium]MBU0803184.1 Na+/H+ antiporter subunit D [Alphaproteobacteria bacterium]MBU0873872.1 Na+/H+ antiporter subunit D [Alphaproteobacteria bacterium]MBU1400628.1 Na+/H+ antiporter subunit D [Alphaproteobacteria bacterium]MBU1590501.1 Na+/H+ antiporter subunit D [Alphaproteobacteria bacterium]
MAGEAAVAVDRTGVMILEQVAASDFLVVAPVVIGIACGALLLMFRHHVRWQAAFSVFGLAAMTAADAALFARVAAEGPLVMTMGSWLPPFGISFTADLLGAGFALVASFVAMLCTVYSVREIGATGRRYGFYPFLMLMMAGVNGAFLTGDIFNLYVWFEVFLIASFGLMILGSEREQIDGATKYAILNLLGTALFLIATAYLYGVVGTLNMADIARKVDLLPATAPVMTISALFLFAFGMKSAAFPVYFWLPASYHTPRIVTGALFGGLLTKIGVYSLLRTMVMLFPEQRLELSGVISWVAVATMILGALGALAQSDIRRMMGFLVISGVGLMLAGLALGDATGLSGAILYAVHSMLAMSALYLLCGTMNEYGGSFSLNSLAGLYRASPLLTAIALVLFLAAAGLPPGSGLWPKVVLAKAAIDLGNGWLVGAILVSGLLTTIALGRVFALAFWRNSAEPGEPVDEAERTPVVPAFGSLIMLTIPILLLGLFPEPFIRMADAAAAGLLDPSAYLRAVFPAAGGGG